MKKILPFIALILVLAFTAQSTFASFYPTGGGTYRLKSSIGTSDSSLTLTSFTEPVSGNKYTMTYLNSSIECATIDPQTTKSEFVSFTGITKNADGSATITGLSRGLGRSYPYTASTTLAQTHTVQAPFILSDAPCTFTQYPAKSNNETITGTWTFSTPPIGGATASTTLFSVTNKLYVGGTATTTIDSGGNATSTSLFAPSLTGTTLAVGGTASTTISSTGVLTSPTINATTALQLGGFSINTAGTLSNVAYLNQQQTFTGLQILNGSASTTQVSSSGAAYFGTTSGTVGVGTTTAVANLQVTNQTGNATTTTEFGRAGQNKGSCMKLYRTDGSAIYAYIAAGATTFTLSTSACATVTGF
jgi:hypothetical protein